MIKKKLLCSALSLALLISGCGSAASSTTAVERNMPAAAAEETTPGETNAEEISAAESSAVTEDTAAADEPGTPEAALLETLSQWSFVFTCGVGAWQTFVEIEKDGTLKGDFSDQNAG